MQTLARRVGEGRAAIEFAIGAALAAAFFFALSATTLSAQSQSGNNGSGGGGSQVGMGSGRSGFGHPGAGPFSSGDDDLDPMMAERRMRALNIERQKQMVADTNKLVKLAKELNDEVGATNAGSFNPDQLRKIAEIEKLARSVRERMSAAVGESQSLLPAPTMIFPVH
jgi:hypothetical protein